MKVNVSVIFNALGMGMAVAVVVLLFLDAITVQDAVMLLGIGLFCVATDALRRVRQIPAEPSPVNSKESSRKRRK